MGGTGGALCRLERRLGGGAGAVEEGRRKEGHDEAGRRRDAMEAPGATTGEGKGGDDYGYLVGPQPVRPKGLIAHWYPLYKLI